MGVGKAVLCFKDVYNCSKCVFVCEEGEHCSVHTQSESLRLRKAVGSGFNHSSQGFSPNLPHGFSLFRFGVNTSC